MPERIAISEELRSRLLDVTLLPCEVWVNGKKYTPDSPVAAGFKGAVWKVRDEFSRLRALKLCILDDYSGRSYLQELSRASILEQYSVFARFTDAGLCEVKFTDDYDHKFVGIVEEWIDGETLDDFLLHYKDLVTTSFFLTYVRTLCNALNALKANNLKHDDMHAKNVMLARPQKADLSSEWIIRIIDTGSMKPLDSTRLKPKDDHLHFVEHLVLIWNVLHSRKSLLVRDSASFLNH